MKLLVYREGAEKMETDFTADQLPELLKEEKTVTWIDMEEPTPQVNALCALVSEWVEITVDRKILKPNSRSKRMLRPEHRQP